jgi:hypothetical protein
VEWVSSGCRYTGASLSEQMCIFLEGFTYNREVHEFISHVFLTTVLNSCVLHSTTVMKNHVFCKRDFS